MSRERRFPTSDARTLEGRKEESDGSFHFTAHSLTILEPANGGMERAEERLVHSRAARKCCHIVASDTFDLWFKTKFCDSLGSI